MLFPSLRRCSVRCSRTFSQRRVTWPALMVLLAICCRRWCGHGYIRSPCPIVQSSHSRPLGTCSANCMDAALSGSSHSERSSDHQGEVCNGRFRWMGGRSDVARAGEGTVPHSCVNHTARHRTGSYQGQRHRADVGDRRSARLECHCGWSYGVGEIRSHDR